MLRVRMDVLALGVLQQKGDETALSHLCCRGALQGTAKQVCGISHATSSLAFPEEKVC